MSNDIKEISDEEFLKQRVILLEGCIDEVNTNLLIRKLMYLMTNDSNSPITLYISSRGGNIYDFLRVYSLLETRQCKLITIALGKCFSCGADLLLLGDERLAYPETVILLHELSTTIDYAKLHDIVIDVEEGKRQTELQYSIIKRKTKIKDVKNFLKDDKWLHTKEALKLGVLTGIVGKK